MSRGLINCNAGLIRHSPTVWVGQSDVQRDPDFVTFNAPQFGIRALAVTLLTYYRKHGLNTVRGLINRWAPPRENDTSAYVSDVAKRVGVISDNPLRVDDPLLLAKLVTAIIIHENGDNPYPAALIANAVDAALKRETVG